MRSDPFRPRFVACHRCAARALSQITFVRWADAKIPEAHLFGTREIFSANLAPLTKRTGIAAMNREPAPYFASIVQTPSQWSGGGWSR
jgi:hypothetical protein